MLVFQQEPSTVKSDDSHKRFPIHILVFKLLYLHSTAVNHFLVSAVTITSKILYYHGCRIVMSDTALFSTANSTFRRGTEMVYCRRVREAIGQVRRLRALEMCPFHCYLLKKSSVVLPIH